MADALMNGGILRYSVIGGLGGMLLGYVNVNWRSGGTATASASASVSGQNFLGGAIAAGLVGWAAGLDLSGVWQPVLIGAVGSGLVNRYVYSAANMVSA